MLLVTSAVITYADPDLWGHVRFGQDILATRSLPTDDPYSFTQDKPWVNHEWLSEVAMAGAYEIGGPVGLVALKIAMVALALFLVYRRLSKTLPPGLCAAALSLVIWGAFPLTTTVRPQLWTFLAVAAAATLMLGHRHRWALPLVFVLWANSHGGWIVGLAMVWIWSLGEWFERRRGDVLLLATAATLATLINPYGWELWQFIAETVRLDRHDISEWQPLWRSPIAESIPWAATVAVAIWVRPKTLSTLVIVAGLAVASARVSRLMPLFVEISVLLLAAERTRPQSSLAPVSRPASSGMRVINAVAVVAIAAAILVRAAPHLTCLPAEPRWAADPNAAQALRGREGRLALEFNWGEYAIWHFGRGLRVSIDGRRETVYSGATSRVQQNLALGLPEGMAWLSASRPEYLWFASDRRELRRQLDKYGYRVDVETGRSFVAVRNDVAPAQSTPPYEPREPRVCFP